MTIGLAVAKRFEWQGVGPYIGTQIAAASVGRGGAVRDRIRLGRVQPVKSGFASNGYGDRSPGGYGVVAALITEIVLAAIFLDVILGTTDDRAPKGFAPIAIGLCLTLICLLSISVTNTSVNPARSLGVAWFAGGGALAQVWLFIVAPIIGAAIAGVSHATITCPNRSQADEGVANKPVSAARTGSSVRGAQAQRNYTEPGRAGMVELVDTQDLGSCAFGCEGSNPSLGTHLLRSLWALADFRSCNRV